MRKNDEIGRCKSGGDKIYAVQLHYLFCHRTEILCFTSFCLEVGCCSFQEILGVLSYNIGPGAVKKSSVYRKLKAGDRDVFKSYTAHCKYKGKFHRGLYKRRCQEFAALFQL